jgi:hypothetical protein
MTVSRLTAKTRRLIVDLRLVYNQEESQIDHIAHFKYCSRVIPSRWFEPGILINTPSHPEGARWIPVLAGIIAPVFVAIAKKEKKSNDNRYDYPAISRFCAQNQVGGPAALDCTGDQDDPHGLGRLRMVAHKRQGKNQFISGETVWRHTGSFGHWQQLQSRAVYGDTGQRGINVYSGLHFHDCQRQ